MTIIYALFGLITLKKYKTKGKIIALHLSLNYFAFSICIFLIFFGYTDIVKNGEKLISYYTILSISNLFAVVGMLYEFLFECDLSTISEDKRKKTVKLGKITMIWIIISIIGLLISSSAIQLTYISYLLVFIFGIMVFVPTTKLFFRTVKLVEQEKRTLKIIGYANVCFILTFIPKMLYSAVESEVLIIMDYSLTFLALLGFFIGYIIPHGE